MTETQEAEIIKFPENRIKRRRHELKTPAEIDQLIQEKKFEHIDFAVATYVQWIAEKIAADGFVQSPQFQNDIAFVGESIISCLTRCHKIPHPLQAFVDEQYSEANAEKHQDDIDPSSNVASPVLISTSNAQVSTPD